MINYCFRYLTRLSLYTIVVAILLSSFSFTSTEAYDALDPNGNITIKWDIISWTADGYVAVVTMFNFQQLRHVSSPGWTLGWTWAKKEVIWSMMGAQTTEQGDCSRYKSASPHCCKKTPTVVDLLPGTPYNQQIANCCKGGAINSWAQSPDNYASFQFSVGAAGTTNKTVKPPKNFTLLAPALYLTRLSLYTIVVAILLSSFSFTSTEAYDALDPNGNITIKWDIISWTPDGYVAVVTMYNFQKYRRVSHPGWTLGWTWAKKEVIWSMMGAQATEQGDCSKYRSSPPHCCQKTPTIVDLLPGTPYNQQIANCCTGGVINPGAHSSFQVSVGKAGNTNKTVKLPVNFTLLAPGPGYKCGHAAVGKPTKFITADGRRVTQAMSKYY
ncbi:Glycosyl-phosphatidyl inositol-anchored [Artemisia annua]|uniref:Glycosyl-phosphatidyl inositol-anchored n=1 Tax=Artemisia annua TaxID=35608 RepID=A0A2U1MPV3_ARTAN|nr:Glycosyl-phosphatidyl inositol-anchored [Artemisia annua]